MKKPDFHPLDGFNNRIVAAPQLSQMRRLSKDNPEAKWVAYACVDKGREFGMIDYINCGPGCTYTEIPKRRPPIGEQEEKAKTYPMYLACGIVNLEKGVIVPW